MLKVSLLELLLRGIPEGILFILSSYIFSKTTINKKRIFVSGIILGTGGYLIRMLPIHFGVHNIIVLIIYILISILMNKFDTIKAIYSALLTVIIFFVCEVANVIILDKLFHVEIKQAFKDPIMKMLYGIPSLILFILIILFYKKGLGKVFNNVFN